MLTQGKDDDKEKWQNSWREACYSLLIEGIKTKNIITGYNLYIYMFKYAIIQLKQQMKGKYEKLWTISL